MSGKNIKDDKFNVDLSCDLAEEVNVADLWIRSDHEPANIAIQNAIQKKLRSKDIRVTKSYTPQNSSASTGSIGKAHDNVMRQVRCMNLPYEKDCKAKLPIDSKM